MEATPALAEQYKDTKHIFFQGLLSPLKLQNIGAHLNTLHCLKIIGREMFAFLLKYDGK